MKIWTRIKDYKISAEILKIKEVKLLEMKNIKIGTKITGLKRLETVEENTSELGNRSK